MDATRGCLYWLATGGGIAVEMIFELHLKKGAEALQNL